MNDWIDAKEKKPFIPGFYYLFVNGEHVPFIAMWGPKAETLWSEYGCFNEDGESLEFTHWMKLPDSPVDIS